VVPDRFRRLRPGDSAATAKVATHEVALVEKLPAESRDPEDLILQEDSPGSTSESNSAPTVDWRSAGLKIAVTVAIFLIVGLLLEHFAEDEVSAGAEWLMDKVGLYGLFAVVFLADGVPQPFTYVPVIWLAVKSSTPKMNVFAVCASASYSAALVGYGIGANLRSFSCGDIFVKKLEQDYPAVQPLMETKGAMGVAMCAIMPVPLAVATWTAGAFKVWIPTFLVAAACRVPKIAMFVLLSRGPKG